METHCEFLNETRVYHGPHASCYVVSCHASLKFVQVPYNIFAIASKLEPFAAAPPFTQHWLALHLKLCHSICNLSCTVPWATITGIVVELQESREYLWHCLLLSELSLLEVSSIAVVSIDLIMRFLRSSSVAVTVPKPINSHSESVDLYA